MRKLKLLLCLLPMLGTWLGANADVNILKSEDGWIRLTAMPSDNWENYYYVIADRHQNLMMQLGKGASQGATYNTLWLQSPVDPLQDQTVLFTIEKTTSASTGTAYGLLRCVAFPDYFLQTENNQPFHYRTHDNGGGDKSWGRLELKTKLTNGSFDYFYMKNGKITSDANYLGAWEDSYDPVNYPVGSEVALNKPAEKQGHYVIYAIRKTDYKALQQTRIDQATLDNPQDVSWYLRDPGMSLSPTQSAWTVASGTLGHGGLTSNRCAEFWNCTFDINQNLTGLQNGVYRLQAQGFYRVGGGTNDATNAAKARAAGKEVINASFYANTVSQPFPSIFANNCTSNKGSNYVSSTGYSINGKSYYVPSTMDRTSVWFSEGAYTSDIIEVVVTDGRLQIGARKTVADSQDWSIFDNFHLFYLGSNQNAEQQAALAELDRYEALLTDKPDAAFAQAIQQAREAIQQASTSEEITAALNVLKGAYHLYLTTGTPTDKAWDITSVIQNADLRLGTIDWTTTGTWNAYAAQSTTTPCVVENFATSGATFALKQRIKLAAGTYRLRGYALHVNNNSDTEATAKMVAAGKSVKVCVRALPITHLIPYNAPSTLHEVSDAFGAGNYRNELLFTLNEDGEVDLGFEGVGTGRTWFVCGPLTLEKVSEFALETEAKAEVEATKELYATRKTAYAKIVKQHTKAGLTLNTNDADTAAEQATTPEQVEQAIRLLNKALTSYMNQFNTTFDLTALILNPSFEKETPLGWFHQTEGGDVGSRDNGNSVYTLSGTAGSRIFNTWITSNSEAFNHYLLQRIDHVPAGDYVLTATFGGDQSGAALKMLANESKTDNIRCSDMKTGVNATLSFTLNSPGSLRIGAKSDRWFKADNFQLKYKSYKTPETWTDRDLGTVNLENEKVKAFLSKADYKRLGAASVVDTYATGVYDKPATVEIRWPELTEPVASLTLTVSDKPDYSGTDTHTRTLTLDPNSLKYNLSNCTPGYTYYYKVEADGTTITNGRFQTVGTVRMIATEGGSNIRDLGGRITLDGRRVKYGRIYRGGEMHQGDQTNMTADDLKEMKRLGITGELDLRNVAQTKGTAPTASAVAGAQYLFVDLTDSEETLCTVAANRTKVKNSIHFIAEQLKRGNVYFHCIWGADRTGAIAFFVENILGCTTEDMYKDFELTSFSKAGHRAANWPNGLTLQSKIVYIQEHYEGATLQDKVVAFLKDCGVTNADINTIRTQLLEDDAEAYAQCLATLKADLQTVIKKAGATWNPDELTSLEAVRKAYNTAMNAVTTEVDLTSLITNPQFTSGTQNWVVRGTVAQGGETNKCVEMYENTGSVRQTLDNMPSGTYILKAQGYQNNGGSVEDAYNIYLDGTAQQTSYILLNNKQQTLRNIFEDAQHTSVATDNEDMPKLGVYVPNSLNGAAKFLQRATLYWNVAEGQLEDMGSLTLGAAQIATETRDWTAIDNFHLYYRGAAYEGHDELLLDEEANISLPKMDSYMTLSKQSNRTLKANGWNTLCVPFDITPEQMVANGITQVKTLASITADGATAQLTFDEAQHIRAGQPYLVRVSHDLPLHTLGTVLVRAKKETAVMLANGKMTGHYNPLASINHICYITTDNMPGNQFVYADSNVSLRGMGAYITTSTGATTFLIEGEEQDAVTEVEAQSVKSAIRYNMQGMRVGPAYKGIIITGGKKKAIR